MDTNIIPAETNDKGNLLTYILEKIDLLAQYPVYVDNAIAQIGAMTVNESMNGGFGDAEKAKSIGISVAAREETNRALIEFLKQMYNDTKPTPTMVQPLSQSEERKMMLAQSLSGLIDRLDPNCIDESELSGILDTIRHILSELSQTL